MIAPVVLLCRLTCDELCEQLVVAVDNIDRHISGGLQEQRAALRGEGLSVSWLIFFLQPSSLPGKKKND